MRRDSPMLTKHGTTVRILHVKAGIDIDSGGPSYSTVNLCRALGQLGVDVDLFTPAPRGDVPSGTGQGFRVHYFGNSRLSPLSCSRDLSRALRERMHEFDLVHVHGVWNLISMSAMRIAQEMKIPYTVTPRGMLSAWHRGWRKFHKEVFFRLFVSKALRNASFVHFLTDEEVRASLRHVSVRKYVVLPNGVWPEDCDGRQVQAFRERFRLGSYPYIAFLGRLHPIKRLDLQRDAFGLLAAQFPDLHWVFAGPDGGLRSSLEGSLERAGIAKRVRFTGLLSGSERLAALAGAIVYCHTSDHEGQSVAITEALACGKPCVVTHGCHFDEIEKAHAGYVLDSNPTAVARAIQGLLNDSALRAMMERNAVSLAETKYSWDRIAREMAGVYRWVTGQGSLPACVRLD